MIKETDKDGTTKYKYVKCPACGSKKRHFERMSEEAIKIGMAKPGHLEAYDHVNRVVADPAKLAVAPIGSEAPSIVVATEICMDCGCVYAPMVIRAKAKKTIAQPTPKIIIPGQGL